MTEFLRNTDYLYDPEYWDGHTFGDECVVSEYSLWGKKLDEEIKRTEEYWRVASVMLRNYEAELDDAPLAQFRPGATFIVDDQPSGTIIRETTEAFELDTNEKESYSPVKRIYGIIVAARKYQGKKQIFQFDKEKDFIDMRSFSGEDGVIEIGRTEHYKRVASTKNIIIAGQELLYKPTLIEIMHLGKGDRETSRSNTQRSWRFSFGRQGV